MSREPRNKPTMTVWRDRLTGGFQVVLDDASGGYRLFGPKFSGISEKVGQHKLTARDIDTVKCWLGVADE